MPKQSTDPVLMLLVLSTNLVINAVYFAATVYDTIENLRRMAHAK